MWVNRRLDKAAVVILASGLVAYSALQPRYRLRPDAPSEFLSEVYSVPAPKREVEKKIARSYWRCAVSQIQWAHGYGHRLPELPPAEFVAGPELGTEASNSATRSRYWRRLQTVWYLPNVWHKDYGWDVAWVKRLIISSGNWLEEQMQGWR